MSMHSFDSDSVLNDIMSLSEASMFFGYSACHLRLLADMGRIKARKSGHVWLVYAPSVREYLYVRGQ